MGIGSRSHRSYKDRVKNFNASDLYIARRSFGDSREMAIRCQTS
jgi:hypothetical protein